MARANLKRERDLLSIFPFWNAIGERTSVAAGEGPRWISPISIPYLSMYMGVLRARLFMVIDHCRENGDVTLELYLPSKAVLRIFLPSQGRRYKGGVYHSSSKCVGKRVAFFFLIK